MVWRVEIITGTLAGVAAARAWTALLSNGAATTPERAARPTATKDKTERIVIDKRGKVSKRQWVGGFRKSDWDEEEKREIKGH